MKNPPVLETIGMSEKIVAAIKSGKIYTSGLGWTASSTNGSFVLRQLVEFEGTEFTQIAVGKDFLVALSKEGQIYTNGYNNDEGQLGRKITSNNSMALLTKIEYLNGKKFIRIAAGDGHILALTDQGELYGCGRNCDGQLGLGNHNQVERFTRIKIKGNPKIQDIWAGDDNSFFTDSKGQLYGCGDNVYFKLGLQKFEHTHELKNEYKQALEFEKIKWPEGSALHSIDSYDANTAFLTTNREILLVGVQEDLDKFCPHVVLPGFRRWHVPEKQKLPPVDQAVVGDRYILVFSNKTGCFYVRGTHSLADDKFIEYKPQSADQIQLKAMKRGIQRETNSRGEGKRGFNKEGEILCLTATGELINLKVKCFSPIIITNGFDFKAEPSQFSFTVEKFTFDEYEVERDHQLERKNTPLLFASRGDVPSFSSLVATTSPSLAQEDERVKTGTGERPVEKSEKIKFEA